MSYSYASVVFILTGPIIALWYHYRVGRYLRLVGFRYNEWSERTVSCYFYAAYVSDWKDCMSMDIEATMECIMRHCGDWSFMDWLWNQVALEIGRSFFQHLAELCHALLNLWLFWALLFEEPTSVFQ